MAIQAGWINALESGILTVTSEALPAYRLYDRQIGLLYKAASSADQTFLLDLGTGTVPTVTSLVIPSGHNLAGCTVQFQYSADNSLWYDQATSWTQGDGALILKTGSARNPRFWKIGVSGAAAAIQFGELFLTNLYTFAAQPVYTGARWSTKRNIGRMESSAGQTSYLKRGDGRKALSYQTAPIASGELSTFEAWDDAAAGKPFFFIDHRSRQFFAEFASDPSYESRENDFTVFSFQVQEVLP